MNQEARQSAAEVFARIMERRNPGTRWSPVVRNGRKGTVPNGRQPLRSIPTPEDQGTILNITDAPRRRAA